MIYFTLSIGDYVWTKRHGYAITTEGSAEPLITVTKWRVLAVGGDLTESAYVSVMDASIEHRIGGPEIAIFPRRQLFSTREGAEKS